MTRSPLLSFLLFGDLSSVRQVPWPEVNEGIVESLEGFKDAQQIQQRQEARWITLPFIDSHMERPPDPCEEEHDAVEDGLIGKP
mmetsp:Transcript_19039/g.45998  ORF Transcript_19039/g.45998 Transcript_19039/m.45998 type:complete len:84 (+) Transcript_19039:551-802(+)